MKKILFALALFATTTAALAFDIVDSKGKRHALDAYKGKWVLVNYWATWCPPCLVEIPDLAALHTDKKNNLVVLGIAVSYQNPNQVIDFARQQGIPYPVILGDDKVIEQIGPVRGLPTTYLYNPQGKLIAYNIGLLSEEAVKKYIAGKQKPGDK
jgi:thiol-disulfide isomerase/thioredoxin